MEGGDDMIWIDQVMGDSGPWKVVGRLVDDPIRVNCAVAATMFPFFYSYYYHHHYTPPPPLQLTWYSDVAPPLKSLRVGKPRMPCSCDTLL